MCVGVSKIMCMHVQVCFMNVRKYVRMFLCMHARVFAYVLCVGMNTLCVRACVDEYTHTCTRHTIIMM